MAFFFKRVANGLSQLEDAASLIWSGTSHSAILRLSGAALNSSGGDRNSFATASTKSLGSSDSFSSLDYGELSSKTSTSPWARDDAS